MLNLKDRLTKDETDEFFELALCGVSVSTANNLSHVDCAINTFNNMVMNLGFSRDYIMKQRNRVAAKVYQYRPEDEPDKGN